MNIKGNFFLKKNNNHVKDTESCPEVKCTEPSQSCTQLNANIPNLRDFEDVAISWKNCISSSYDCLH